MEALQDEQLFGAPPGHLVGVSVSVTLLEAGYGSVVLHGHAANRKKLMTVRALFTVDQEVNTIAGAIAPILIKSGGMSVPSFRRHAWAVHNRLGRLGYQVSIENCGPEPKH